MTDVAGKPPRPSYSFAKRNGVAITGWDGATAQVSFSEVAAATAIAEVRRYLAAPLALTRVSSTDFEQLLQRLYDGGDPAGPMASQLEQGLGDELDLHQVADELSQPADLLESEDDAPIIRLINAVLTEAVKSGASDIHIEPQETALLVRFRVDGVLQEVLTPPRAIASLVVSRIKVMARLDIAEKRVPQDGRIALRIAGRPIDVRVSTIPANHGERVVLRLLDKQAGRLDLSQLGMSAAMEERIDALIHRPHGILLVTGPTGSGKTTTLYAALQRLNDRSRNILTVEDPIEYDIDGIGQTQVNSKVDMSFARGLRAILRQDPDVVMVGEIRDLETAQIAVQASLTGHLVLSTLHTNTAIGAVTRLRDMGVEPFLLSSSLIGVLAQRLVRQLDPNHREPYAVPVSEATALGLDPAQAGQTAYRAASNRYRGRSGIYELINIDETLRGLIHDSASEQTLLVHARQSSPPLIADGIEKILAGQTTVDEVLRVTREG